MVDKSTNAIAWKVQERLLEDGIESPIVGQLTARAPLKIQEAFESIMTTLGLDMKDDSLRGTPGRVGRMLGGEIFYGLDYGNFPNCTVFRNKMKIDELVLLTNIDVRSMCEHHFVPFIGMCHVGYIPKTNIIGLSKINRVVDFFCRRPQVQERLTVQIATALEVILDTKDIAVVIEAKHFCSIMRGVKQDNTVTKTSKMTGRFMAKAELRAEFLSLIKG